jgi:hypothetical protein
MHTWFYYSRNLGNVNSVSLSLRKAVSDETRLAVKNASKNVGIRVEPVREGAASYARQAPIEGIVLHTGEF